MDFNLQFKKYFKVLKTNYDVLMLCSATTQETNPSLPIPTQNGHHLKTTALSVHILNTYDKI